MRRPFQDDPTPRSDRHGQPPAGVFPTAEEIAIGAFDIFVQSKRKLSRRDCWRRAEALLLDRAARRIIRF